MTLIANHPIECPWCPAKTDYIFTRTLLHAFKQEDNRKAAGIAVCVDAIANNTDRMAFLVSWWKHTANRRERWKGFRY